MAGWGDIYIQPPTSVCSPPFFPEVLPFCSKTVGNLKLKTHHRRGSLMGGFVGDQVEPSVFDLKKLEAEAANYGEAIKG